MGGSPAPSDGAMSPPPLPPRARVLSTPPPPLPPRDGLPSASPRDALPSRSSTQYQAFKRQSCKESPRAVTAPSATPPSSLEQLAEQTGLSTQEIQNMLYEHGRQQAAKDGRAPVSPPHTEYSHPQRPLYNTGAGGLTQTQYQRVTTYPVNGGGSQYSTPPPPPYQPTSNYQPSPASSVTSGSSNDYLLLNYKEHLTGGPEYRTAYGESPSSGKRQFLHYFLPDERGELPQGIALLPTRGRAISVIGYPYILLGSLQPQTWSHVWFTLHSLK